MKCLPASKLHACNGVGIHDWHAEVLAIRAFNRYLLDECSRLLQDEQSSEILTRSSPDSRNGPGIAAVECYIGSFSEDAQIFSPVIFGCWVDGVFFVSSGDGAMGKCRRKQI